MTPPLADRIRSDLADLAREHDVPGVAVAVLSGGRTTVATHGVTSTRSGVTVTADTLFQIQSTTKVATAALVLQLVQEGLLGLDQPVRDVLPGFRTADPDAGARVTVRHLLTHTGGFEGDLWQPTTSGPDALERFVTDLVPGADQHSSPGERFSYCNAGFGVLGRIVEVLRGTTYERALRDHLAGPLGIEELAFSANQALAFRTATGHVRPDPDGSLVPTREWAVLPPSNPAAGNQLAMSAPGLLALGRLLLDDVGPGSGLLSPASVRALLTPQVRLPGWSVTTGHQGLGWRLGPDGRVEHGGGSVGVASHLVVVPEQRVAVAVLTSSGGGHRLVADLLDPLLHDLAGLDPLPTPPTPDPGVPADPTGRLGRYATRQTGFEVSADPSGRWWLTRRPRHEQVSMAELAGLTTGPTRQELRVLEGDVLAVIGDDGRSTGVVVLEPGRDGRPARLHADDRSALRED